MPCSHRELCEFIDEHHMVVKAEFAPIRRLEHLAPHSQRNSISKILWRRISKGIPGRIRDGQDKLRIGCFVRHCPRKLRIAFDRSVWQLQQDGRQSFHHLVLITASWDRVVRGSKFNELLTLSEPTLALTRRHWPPERATGANLRLCCRRIRRGGKVTSMPMVRTTSHHKLLRGAPDLTTTRGSYSTPAYLHSFRVWADT